ncbi:MAG: hypothetical protein P8Z37_07610, partial [Acidobacteriota bacterium]
AYIFYLIRIYSTISVESGSIADWDCILNHEVYKKLFFAVLVVFVVQFLMWLLSRLMERIQGVCMVARGCGTFPIDGWRY